MSLYFSEYRLKEQIVYVMMAKTSEYHPRYPSDSFWEVGSHKCSEHTVKDIQSFLQHRLVLCVLGQKMKQPMHASDGLNPRQVCGDCRGKFWKPGETVEKRLDSGSRELPGPVLEHSGISSRLEPRSQPRQVSAACSTPRLADTWWEDHHVFTEVPAMQLRPC